MSESEQYLAEIETVEMQAAGLLDSGAADEGATRLISTMRKALKQHKKVVDRIREEARAEARAELIAERKAEAGFRRLGVPEGPARALFEGTDPADQTAMQARADELHAVGITWNGQPQPAPPPGPDPMEQTIGGMQMAAAGGNGGGPGDLATRMRAMEANPGAYSDAQHEEIVREYNDAVRRSTNRTSGALG
jgi:hypothetical protein